MWIKNFLTVTVDRVKFPQEQKRTDCGQLNTSEQQISADEYNRMREEVQEHFDRKFDFNTIAGIDSIPVRSYYYIDNITGSIDYILQRKASVHKQNGRLDLAIACLRKANDIMVISHMTWAERDYMRLVQCLIEDGQFDEAYEEWKKIKNGEKGLTTLHAVHLATFKITLEHARDLEVDLIMLQEHEYTCAECAKYQGRLFSISGNDKRFPKLLPQFYQYGGVHKNCRHSFTPVIPSFTLTTVEFKAKIKLAKKPFTDNRTQEDIDGYEKRKARIELLPKFDEQWFDLEVEKTLERSRYKKICEILPDIAPKSYSGYRRMKLNRTNNYLKLVASAKECGFIIDE